MLDNMDLIKNRKVPMTTVERQRKYLANPENIAKHRERQKQYYLKVIKPKREALKRTRERQEIEDYIKLVQRF